MCPTQNMLRTITTRSLSTPEPMTIAIRPLVEADLPVVDRILQAAFGRSFSFEPMLRLNGAAQPGNQLVAVADEHVVATVGAVDYGDFAYVALMGVDPAYTRRGIARRMMDAVLTRLDQRGCPVVLLDATEAGAALYTQIGFVDDSTAYEFEGEWPATVPEPPAASGTIAPLATADLDEVIAFDTPRFGADRTPVLRLLQAEHPQQALVSRDQAGRVNGYLFMRVVIGPWVAADMATAERLLIAARQRLSPSPVRVLVPRSNQQACELLTRHGLHMLRPLRHMRRGGTKPPGEPACLFGQVNFGLG